MWLVEEERVPSKQRIGRLASEWWLQLSVGKIEASWVVGMLRIEHSDPQLDKPSDFSHTPVIDEGFLALYASLDEL